MYSHAVSVRVTPDSTGPNPPSLPTASWRRSYDPDGYFLVVEDACGERAVRRCVLLR